MGVLFYDGLQALFEAGIKPGKCINWVGDI